MIAICFLTSKYLVQSDFSSVVIFSIVCSVFGRKTLIIRIFCYCCYKLKSFPVESRNHVKNRTAIEAKESDCLKAILQTHEWLFFHDQLLQFTFNIYAFVVSIATCFQPIYYLTVKVIKVKVIKQKINSFLQLAVVCLSRRTRKELPFWSLIKPFQNLKGKLN